MNRNNLAVIIAVAVVVLGGGAAILALSRPNSSTMNDMENSSMQTSDSKASMSDAVEADTVEIKGFSFKPQDIKVKAGTKVTWTNQDSVKHNVVADNGEGPKGPLLAKGESYSYTFEKAGTYAYHCQPHTDMTATVFVTE